MKREKSTTSKIISWISIILLLILIYFLFDVFKQYYFNGFIKAESNIGISQFTRDKDIKYSETSSYKIVSTELNDAAFYKEIEVEPNNIYKVTCKIKTENVVPESINTDAGANISLIEDLEISRSITGTSDWQQVELLFNSKNREVVKIGFRLGGNTGNAKGIAWFSDFKLERGIKSEDTNWNVACFVLKNINLQKDGKDINIKMKTSDIDTIYNDMQRFKTTCSELSKGKMTVNYNVYEIDEPITTVSYKEEHGNYFAPYDVTSNIDNIIKENEIDYIFIAVRMGDEEQELYVNNWIGLR
ncbi:MAG: hypothetical protein E7314_04760 [Clostridiales bacterium]|nr:hypothetical protein [Clostridiales bacterium]